MDILPTDAITTWGIWDVALISWVTLILQVVKLHMSFALNYMVVDVLNVEIVLLGVNDSEFSGIL